MFVFIFAESGDNHRAGTGGDKVSVQLEDLEECVGSCVIPARTGRTLPSVYQAPVFLPAGEYTSDC